MTEHAYYTELAALAALGALDGEDLRLFEGHLVSCLPCRVELDGLERVARQLPLVVPPVPPRKELQARVLAEALGTRLRGGGARPRAWAWPALAAATLVTIAVGTWIDRQRAHRDAEAAHVLAAAAQDRAEAALSQLRNALARERALTRMLEDPAARFAALAPPPAGAEARARVLWNPALREGLLVARGLAPAPAGKAYELWVIADGAPVPAGVFQVDSEGRAVMRLPPIDTTGVKTFAVTLELEAGSDAPTGPILLAGPAAP